MTPLTQRVAGRFLVQSGYFNQGDVVLYGKYKNHHGKIVGFGSDKWGNPTVEVEPVPKGRKENKVFGLYRIWRADVKEKALAEQAKQASDYDPTDGVIEVAPENACISGDPRNCRHEGDGPGRFDERPEGGLPEDPLFGVQLEPDDEDDEDEPFERESSLIGATPACRSDVSRDPMVERVAQRFLAASLHWKKTPLNSIKGDSGIYARSEPDGRFLVFVHRWRNGQPGDRKYTLFYSAMDYQTPSGGKGYTEIPIPGPRRDNNSVDAAKVFAAVEKWAHEHPLPPLEPKAS